MARPTARFAFGSVTIAITCAWACLAPTQIELQLSTDVGCDVVAANGAVIYGDGAASRRITATTMCSGDGASRDLGTLVIAPSSDRDARVTISVALGVTRPTETCAQHAYQGCILARRRISYVPHEPLVLPVALERVCIDQPCPEEQTCSGGVCVIADVDDPAFCVGARCSSGVPDSGGADASIPDGPAAESASTDAPVATVDAPPPTGLVLSGSDVRGLASDGVWMYFTRTPSDVMRILMSDLRAGIGTPTLIDSVQKPGGVAVDGMNVYVAGRSPDSTCAKYWDLATLGNSDGFDCGLIQTPIRGIAPYGVNMAPAFFLVTDDGTKILTSTEPIENGQNMGHAESDGAEIFVTSGDAILKFSGSFPANQEASNLGRNLVGIAVTVGYFYLTTAGNELIELQRGTTQARDITNNRFATSETLNEVAFVPGDGLYVATSLGIRRFTDVTQK